MACLLSHAGVAGSTPDFDRDVRPILAEHCLECHSLDKAKGGLALTTRSDAMKMLKSGDAGIVPGDAGSSAVISRVETRKVDERMPPEDRPPLTAAQTATLREWVAAGADWPAHWAYRPLAQPPLPATRDAVWPRGEIDRFVLAKLEAAGLQPSPEADRATLIRRVHLDLLGLLPSPRQVANFVSDSSPDAYEKMVDAALASEHYGERWGRHWLDMARYADSDGYEKDRPRPDAWRYRDWVIQAVNENLPFDRFTIEQLAGDLLPSADPQQVLATAFHRQTLTNTEGGTDQEQFRVEAVFDRTETTGAVWLGLSVGCARCHSHKYDQISHQEYFQLYAFFNNGDEVTRQVATSQQAWEAYEKQHGADAARLGALQKRLDEARAGLQGRLAALEKPLQERLADARKAPAKARYEPLEIAEIRSSGKQTAFTRKDDGSWLAGGAQSKQEVYEIVVNSWREPLVALQLEVLPDDSLPGHGPGRAGKGNFVLSELKVSVGRDAASALPVALHSAAADFEQKSFTGKAAVDGDRETGWAVQPQFGKAHQLTVQFEEPANPAPGVKLFVSLDHAYKSGNHNIGRLRLLGSTVLTEESVVPPDVLRVLNEEPLRRNDVVIKPLLDWVEKRDPETRSASAALEAARQRLPKPPLMDVRVIAQRTQQPRATHRLQRGDFLSPGEGVTPGGLGVLPALTGRNANHLPADRLDLARWLVSPENPLTPRVTVNHIWARLFGEGLVRTVNDFGVRGERPSHPELLDWLAQDFIGREGWSRKRLIKVILMSATYRQSSVHRPELADVDPLNRLLHRQNRLRAEAEIVRDLHLDASGLLSAKVGGPSVFPPLPPNVAELSYANNFKWATSTGEDRYRRGMYTFFKRTAPHPDLTTFDCPDANTTNVKRTVSNTPLQALTTLNAGTFADAAKGLASRVLKEEQAGVTPGLDRLFVICLSRHASSGELSSLQGVLDDARRWYLAHPDEATKFIKGFEVSSVPPSELAAWAATARVVLNLDEFITRE